MPEIARMAASFIACLARPNGAPHSLPYGRFRAFACAFHMETVPNARSDGTVVGRRGAMRRAADGCRL
ncbi:hypothetical protein DIE22_22050 [Burkholderia sp. Bp9142]|nr:hypothetical protein DIE22_22050 [Burkholderia sp. Bp9142]RQR47985.1 hypothetical protein DIE21_24285 [Burkholderia sp. Bp9140]